MMVGWVSLLPSPSEVFWWVLMVELAIVQGSPIPRRTKAQSAHKRRPGSSMGLEHELLFALPILQVLLHLALQITVHRYQASIPHVQTLDYSNSRLHPPSLFHLASRISLSLSRHASLFVTSSQNHGLIGLRSPTETAPVRCGRESPSSSTLPLHLSQFAQDLISYKTSTRNHPSLRSCLDSALRLPF